MPPRIIRDNIKRIKDSKSSEGNEIKTTENNETTAKAVTYDVTKAHVASDEIIDILDTPDVAVWSKGINNKANTHADKAPKPSRVKSNINYPSEQSEEE